MPEASFAEILLGLLLGGVLLVLLCFKFIPEKFVRGLNWLLMHSVYRMRVVGAENIPAQGGALIVCNHVSFVDPALLLGAVRRPIRFLMFRPLYEAPLFHPFARAMQAIPISGSDGHEKVAEALAEARRRVEQGELVGIFAEGGITRTGHLLPFRSGLETIMKDVDAPIIPAYLDQVWGSIFSFAQGRFLWKRPKEVPYPVTVAFGRAMPGPSSAEQVRQAVQELGADAFSYRRTEFQNIKDGVKRSARRGLSKVCVVDSIGGRASFLELYSAARVLLAQIERELGTSERVAVVGCPSVQTLAANIALALSNRVSVNLDQADEAGLTLQLMQAAEVSSAIVMDEATAAKFSDSNVKVIQLPPKLRTNSLFTLLRLCTPFLGRGGEVDRDREATVVFTRGRTGRRKAVRLSHGNICANIESVFDVLQLSSRDVLGIAVPPPNAFAVTLGVWLPLLAGMQVVYGRSETSAADFAEMIFEHSVTLLLLPADSLEAFTEQVAPEKLASVRQVFVGGASVSEAAAIEFQCKFDVQLFEGYGAAELAPMALINVPDYDYGKGRQVGRKLGSAGHPLPGVAVKVVTEVELEPVPVGEEGLLLVKGPNVMLGYVGEENGLNPVNNGWFDTGDRASLDTDGFVTILN
ncbi:MAG: AMP-binding protein [Bdellovibrionales bacterium]|nr:AMP-binding protein [Bdellovibrionales bacterium]